MKNIILVQHTQSIHDTNGMMGLATNWELTNLGRQQADKIGRKLSAELKGKNFVTYASDLLRAKQTAEEISQYLEMTPIFKSELRERLIPFYEEVLNSLGEIIIIVSDGDTLSIFCAMWLKFEVTDLNDKDLFGMAGGVSF